MEHAQTRTRTYTVPWWTPLAMAGASVAANLLLREMALTVGPASLRLFFPLVGIGTTVVLTLLGALGAYAVFWFLARTTTRPFPILLAVAAVVLLVSFLPDLALPRGMGGWSEFAVGVLMLMHVVAAAIDIGLLWWLTRR